MAKKLIDNITSKYFKAANQLTSKKARRKIIAYVESYDDILFWRQVLGQYEDETRFFEIMLPTRNRLLDRGKKAAISNMMKHLGEDMIACVDADYDYLLQGCTGTSIQVIHNPYILHTYVYAIENYQCYAPSLHDTCVMVTLNDARIFDFEDYLRRYSNLVYPLFLWNIWAYRTPDFDDFTIMDFNKIITIPVVKLNNLDEIYAALQSKIAAKLDQLEKAHPEDVKGVKKLAHELVKLGVTPDNTYLYIQGHHLFNNIVGTVVENVCDRLIVMREQEIKEQSRHISQQYSELSCYDDSVSQVKSMLKKNVGYQKSSQFKQLCADVDRLLNTPEEELMKDVETMNLELLKYEAMKREARFQRRQARKVLEANEEKRKSMENAECFDEEIEE